MDSEKEREMVKKMLVESNVIDLDMAMRAWDIKPGRILTTKDGRKVKVVSVGNDQRMTVEVSGKQAIYAQSQIIRSLLTGNMT